MPCSNTIGVFRSSGHIDTVHILSASPTVGPISTYQPLYGVFKTMRVHKKKNRKQNISINKFPIVVLIFAIFFGIEWISGALHIHLHDNNFFSAARSIDSDDALDVQFNQHKNPLNVIKETHLKFTLRIDFDDVLINVLFSLLISKKKTILR